MLRIPVATDALGGFCCAPLNIISLREYVVGGSVNSSVSQELIEKNTGARSPIKTVSLVHLMVARFQ